ncbi:mitochondrial import inner membrane translocase subunit TIM50-like isoform X3 [Asparagus officinalis]|uniref:mitochondrial import inner membrane translocase subunit TIM50-like isoform X3 n=1 Tax=Asparagus officinalis TaxID=4686 RepID=UPI00098E2464|nr:mitochondrial import inner membrane translocase subunit TIM50-like isoform X3 [Asparagus officinalis]
MNRKLKLQFPEMVDSDCQRYAFSHYIFVSFPEIVISAKSIEQLDIDMRRMIEEQIQGYTEPLSEKLLPDLPPQEQNVLTLVLDINETLVHSDRKRERGWRTFKRPGVDAFLEHLVRFYEIVVYSDQLSMYVDPFVERLDQKGCIRYRLARNAARYLNGKHYRLCISWIENISRSRLGDSDHRLFYQFSTSFVLGWISLPLSAVHHQ